MFKYLCEGAVEVNIPILKVWAFYINPSNWPKWTDQVESCDFEGELKAGTTIKAKIKNRNAYLPILITELKPYNECKLLIKVPLFIQESCSIFQEISPERTRIIMKTSVTSLLVPFMKSFFFKRLESSNSRSLRILLETNEYPPSLIFSLAFGFLEDNFLAAPLIYGAINRD